MEGLENLTDEELEILSTQGIDSLSDDALTRLSGVNPVPNPVETVQAPPPLSGVPGMAMEAVSGANRAGAQAFDIVTAPAQALLNAAGIDVPTLRSTIPEREAFAGPGLSTDIASAAGELGVSSVNFGALTRLLSSGLDDIARYGEDAISGVLRVMGRATPAQDVALGMASGAGGEVAANALEDTLGEDSARLLGQVVSPAAWVATTSSIRTVGNKLLDSLDGGLLRQGIPTTQQIKGAGRALYTKLDEAGIYAGKNESDRLSTMLDAFIKDENIDASLAGTNRVMNLLKRQAKTGEVPYGYLDRMSSDLNDIVVAGGSDGTVAKRAKEMIDDFIIQLKPTNRSDLDNKTIEQTLRDAREFWRRSSVSEVLEDAVFKTTVKDEAGGPNYFKALRKEFANILTSKTKSKFFTADEKAQMREAIKGGRAQNLLALVGRAAPNSEDWTKLLLFGSTYGAIKGTIPVAEALAAIGAVGITEGARVSSQRLFGRSANLLRQSIRAGTDGKQVIKAYMRNVPRSRRNPGELASLLLNNKADLTAVRDSGMMSSGFINDSVALAITAEQISNQQQ